MMRKSSPFLPLPIFEPADGRHYVLLDEEGIREYGVWLIPEGEPEPTFTIPAKD